MRNIIRLIQKYRNFLFFLVLELISFLFIFNWRNSFHHSTFIGASNSVTGYMYESKTSILNYFNLREINEKLQYENQYLREKLHNQEIKLGKKFLKVNDSLYLRNYKFLKVEILNSQYKYVENSILLNKGKTNGIKDKMGVIGVNGVIGVINKSSSYYSSVVPVINPHFVLSVIHKSSSTWGNLQWVANVNTYQTATISNIPNYTPIKEGDLFVTTGSDGIFPKGIPIGMVKNFEKNTETQMMKVEISLSEDFSNTHTGFVVYNSVRDELFNYNTTK
jgi:rod shape-determining protein MreC